MQIRRILALVALTAVAAPTFADNFSLGTLGVPSETHYTRYFWSPSASDVVDNFTFTISQAASASGLVTEVDPWLNLLDIDVKSVSLLGGASYTGASLAGPLSFGALAAGTYTLRIVTAVTGFTGLLIPPNYELVVNLRGARTSVPAPGVVLLYGLGLLGVVFASRRRRVVQQHG